MAAYVQHPSFPLFWQILDSTLPMQQCSQELSYPKTVLRIRVGSFAG